MKTLQALDILKQCLDMATKGGIFSNMDASFTAAQAYNIIATKIKESTPENE